MKNLKIYTAMIMNGISYPETIYLISYSIFQLEDNEIRS